MGAGHSAEGDGGAYASDPPAQDRRKTHNRRRRHSVDSVASYSSQNHVDRIRTQNFSAASCHDEDFGSIKTSLFRRSSSTNLDCPHKRPESVTSNASSTRSRLRELVERKQDEHKSAANPVEDIQYFENPTETLEFDKPRNSLEKKQEERPKKRKLTKNKDKDKDSGDTKNKKPEKYQSKLAEYYKLPAPQLPQDEFYQHLTRSKTAEEVLQKRFANLDTELSGSYGRLCKHKEAEGSNLRRSRSLAVIREETFTDLQIQNHAKNKRSQLIPRARLFDKPCFKDRLIGRAKYQTKEEVLESIYIESTASCFGDINAQRDNDKLIGSIENQSQKEDAVSREGSHYSRSVSGSWPNLNEDTKQTHLSEESIAHSRNPSDIDSLDSNYVRKHYNFEAHRKNYKDSSPESERSIVSPNHSKDLYVTTDDHETDNEDGDRTKNTTPKSFTNDSLSATQSEKDKTEPVEHEPAAEDADSYDEVSIRSIKSEAKENTQPEPENKITTEKEGDEQSVASENDGTISSPPDSITSYISISIASSGDKSHKLEYLANSLAEKIDEYCDSQFKETVSVISNTETNNPENDPIYTKVNKKKTFADIRRDSISNKNGNNNIFHEVYKKNSEPYVSNAYAESDTYSTKSHCTSTKNITTEPFVTTLIENQYYSLPDINISKCLRKSERIDAQLREEDPEDIPCENTYEIAETHFRDILSNKGTENYGQLNKTSNHIRKAQSLTNSCIYQPEYTETHLIHNFAKLEDDLKSILTIESSNDDRDTHFYSLQNEREINEIEGTIRNNKLISKSESLKISNTLFKPEVHISKSFSNDNIRSCIQDSKHRTGIKKHYSLRQRDPEDDIHRMPSPGTVARTLSKPIVSQNKPTQIDEQKTPLLTRVQSFKTTPESSIAIVPLSGHQTIVIDPPVEQEKKENTTISLPQEFQLNKDQQLNQNIQKESTANKNIIESASERKEPKKIKVKVSPIDTSSYCSRLEPFITIKLNKVVKTTVPKLNFSEKIACTQLKFEKPPTRLIIKDNKNSSSSTNPPVTAVAKVNSNMTRPQILNVVDSKNPKTITQVRVEKPLEEISSVSTNTKVETGMKFEIKDSKNDNVREKLNNAIKTDIEYQEKLNSVKNYWSKLADSKEGKNETTPKPEETDVNTKNKSNDVQNVNEDENQPDDNTSLPEISVNSIIKSLESVKIVDSIRKISQTKLPLWKDETEKVKSDSEIEESTLDKIVKDCEGNVYEKPKPKKTDVDLCRDTPEIEIVELSSDDNANQKTQATLIKAKGFDKGCDEFDHVRYKVMKSELFKNSMIANYRKEAQFDGLLQYLQDYSFQELLVNNNIVIIEPVRTKIEQPRRNNTDTCKIPPTLLKKTDGTCGQVDRSKNAIRRHFFYHPIRVNKEIIEEELPNPDTVKKVRNLFEDTLKMKSPMNQDPPLIDELGLTRRATSYRNLNEDSKGTKIGGRKKVIRQLTIDTNYGNKKWDNASLSSGVSSGDLSSNNEYEDGLSPRSHKNLKDNAYSSSDEYLCDSMSQDFCCESQYVSPDILKKIRECGTSVTYYGGKVLNSKPGTAVSPMTKAIMDEIKSLQKNCSRDCYVCQTKCRGEKCSCLSSDKHKQILEEKTNSTTSSDSGNPGQDKNKRTDGFPGFKFKLVKSNSCSSRLELTGTDDSKNPRLRFRRQTEDPPIVYDDENSVKNKICRLESYNKGIVKTPFDNKESEDMMTNKATNEVNKISEIRAMIKEGQNQQDQDNKNENQGDKPNDPHSFEKKFYYLNENLDKTKVSTGKFGEMVFEEFEVLESCFDSLNSNKSMK